MFAGDSLHLRSGAFFSSDGLFGVDSFNRSSMAMVMLISWYQTSWPVPGSSKGNGSRPPECWKKPPARKPFWCTAAGLYGLESSGGWPKFTGNWDERRTPEGSKKNSSSC